MTEALDLKEKFGRLQRLAREINELHETAQAMALDCTRRMGAALKEALLCGRLLAQVREECNEGKRGRSGKFSKWLASNCPRISRSTAYRYIRLIESDLTQLNQPRGLWQAYQMLAEPGRPESEPEQPPAIDVEAEVTPGLPKPPASFARYCAHIKSRPVEHWPPDERENFKQWYDTIFMPLAAIRQQLN